jgi:hypothetical protein
MACKDGSPQTHRDTEKSKVRNCGEHKEGGGHGVEIFPRARVLVAADWSTAGCAGVWNHLPSVFSVHSVPCRFAFDFVFSVSLCLCGEPFTQKA